MKLILVNDIDEDMAELRKARDSFMRTPQTYTQKGKEKNIDKLYDLIKRIDAKLKTDKGNSKYHQYAKELDDMRRKMVFLK